MAGKKRAMPMPSLQVSAGKPRRRHGAATVELAILLPFILFLFALGCDWCRIFYMAHTLDDCARTGALTASGIAYQEYGLSNSERESRGKAEALTHASNLNPALKDSDITASVDVAHVTVTVNYDFNTLAPYPVIGGTWKLSRSVCMPILR